MIIIIIITDSVDPVDSVSLDVAEIRRVGSKMGLF